MKNQLTKIILIWLFFSSASEIIISQNLVVQQINGAENSIPLSSVRKLLFADNSIYFRNTAGNSIDFQLKDIRKLFFSNSSSSSDITGDENEKIIIYPNPSSMELYIKIDDHETNCIEIYNVQGRKIKTVFVNDVIVKIEINDLQPGIYVLKTGSQISKFVKL